MMRDITMSVPRTLYKIIIRLDLRVRVTACLSTSHLTYSPGHEVIKAQ